jgi:hypothetical protein
MIMSTISRKIRLGLAVILGGGLLLGSAFGITGWTPYAPPPLAAKDKADTLAGLAILQSARTPIVGAQLCDAIKGFLPNKFPTADGDTKMSTPTTKPVILCFKGSFDYDDALNAAHARRLGWERGLGGRKVLIFAASEAAFTAFARANHMTVGPGDLRQLSPLMDRLVAQPRSRRQSDIWLIQPGSVAEVIYGPYLDMPPGRYRLEMVFESGAGPNCQSLDHRLQVSAAVAANVRALMLAPKQALALTPLDDKGCRLAASLSFTVPAGGARKLETPLWTASNVPVRLTDYRLTPES